MATGIHPGYRGFICPGVLLNFYLCQFFVLYVTGISSSVSASHISISPPSHNVFLIHRTTRSDSHTTHPQRINFNGSIRQELYVHDGCPDPETKVQSTLGGRTFSMPLSSAINSEIGSQLHCSVVVKLAHTRIAAARPYVDAVVFRDLSWFPSHLVQNHRLCVTVQFANSANGASVRGSCSLNSGDSLQQSCLIRREIPFTWFDLNGSADKQKNVITASYSVDTHCSANQRFMLLDNSNIELINDDPHTKLQATPLHHYKNEKISLVSPANLSFTANSMGALFINYRHEIGESTLNLDNNSTAAVNKTNAPAIKIKMWIDPKLEIMSAVPIHSGKWTKKVQTFVDPSQYTVYTLTMVNDDVAIKQKPKSDNTENSVEMSDPEEYIFALLLKLKNSPSNDQYSKSYEDNPISAEQIIQQAVIYWSVKIFDNDASGDLLHSGTEEKLPNSYNSSNSRSIPQSYHAQKFMEIKFPIVSTDESYAIVPIAKRDSLLNTAVLSGEPIFLPLRIVSISSAGYLRDVTSESHCIAGDNKVLKTSPTCSMVFLDGSETGGSSNQGAVIHVQHSSLTTSVHFTVWYPKLPVAIHLDDPVLNPIDEWRVSGAKRAVRLTASVSLERRKRKRVHRRSSSGLSCHLRHQQTEVRVFVTFETSYKENGERFVLGSNDDRNDEMLFDVTQLVKSQLKSADPTIVDLVWKPQGNEGGVSVVAVPRNVGTTRIILRDPKYGSAHVAVSSETTSIIDMSIEPVVDLSVKIYPVPHSMGVYYADTVPSIFGLRQQVKSTFVHQYQTASLNFKVFYSDGHSEILSFIDKHEYSLKIEAIPKGAIKLLPQARTSEPEEIIALSSQSSEDKQGPRLTVELSGAKGCVRGDQLSAYGLITSSVGLRMDFEDEKVFDSTMEKSEEILMEESNPFPSSSTLGLIVTIFLLIGLFCVMSGMRVRAIGCGIHNGYEKLVMPLLARLGSNQSISSAVIPPNAGHDCVSTVSTNSANRRNVNKKSQVENEFVWLPKDPPSNSSREYSASIGSQYSQRSTLGLRSNKARSYSHTSSNTSGSRPSSDENRIDYADEEPCSCTLDKHRDNCPGVSYHGSEISVFLAPNSHCESKVSVNDDRYQTAITNGDSWRRRCSTGGWRAIEKNRHLSQRSETLAIRPQNSAQNTFGDETRFSNSSVPGNHHNGGRENFYSEVELNDTLSKKSKNRPTRQSSHSGSHASSHTSNSTLREQFLSTNAQFPNTAPPPPPGYESGRQKCRQKSLDAGGNDLDNSGCKRKKKGAPNDFQYLPPSSKCDNQSLPQPRRLRETFA
ncbi:transmembrane protein family domain-containing protein [Ditylenchus destructor]|nr:transmembrane protein family domain-containing protein [Ditylenchus destructor]